jgi:hypothetical protein
MTKLTVIQLKALKLSDVGGTIRDEGGLWGKRLPEKDDEFTLTTQVQNRDGWMLQAVNRCMCLGDPRQPVTLGGLQV